MRYIRLNKILRAMFADSTGTKEKKRLLRSHKQLMSMTPAQRTDYIRKYGSSKWRPLKNAMLSALGNKCWYSEVEITGGSLTIDHFRPSVSYWWLAFYPYNYRIASPFSNSPQHNELHGCAGGKGDSFPLLDEARRASRKRRLRFEKPLLLDPCNRYDCDLVAFQIDGRPVLNPIFASDPDALMRLEASNLLLNLDHPDFNSKREQLCRDIALDVKAHEELPANSLSKPDLHQRIKSRIEVGAPFSRAARYYLRLHRDLDWVEALLAE